MATYRVAFLSKLDSQIQDIVRKVAPADISLTIARSEAAEDIFDAAENADFFIARAPRITRELMLHAPKLRLIQKFGIGVDKIDVDAARELGIQVAITAGANSIAVAEHTVMLMLAVNRRLTYLDRKMRIGEWHRDEMRSQCYQLHGKTIGLLGLGNIGRAVSRLIRPFDVKVLYFDLRRASPDIERDLGIAYVPLDEIFRRSDIVSVHVPLTPDTEMIVSAKSIGEMKDGSVLINTARGELVDEAALLAALESGHLRGAGIDAFVDEPLPNDHPFLANDRIVMTPHTAGAVFDEVETRCQHIFDNIGLVIHGQELRPEDRVVGAKP